MTEPRGALPALRTEWVLELPYARPPLTMNQRLHWAARSDLTRTIRSTTALLANQAKVPRMAKCEVTLYWTPRDRRVRDAENPVPTLKAICDGLVDVHVVADDTPEFMHKNMPHITAPGRPARMWLTIRRIT